ncbi:MAG: hypothetical protein ONB44_24460 [candidate division KSB1 bacterium]|nr:hypothetical protein [candidate division KSB1 bacterium]MDZ7305289.1 hypothetical protein [candidate division KSB1 bacterium]MDZ7314382.1 hypothetical protein [candidate division KSB1 bacterium]
MFQWLAKLPLPLWATLLIAAALLAGVVLLFRRRFRMKTVGIGASGPYLEFERKSPEETPPSASGIDQQVIAEKGGSVSEVEQTAEGSRIRQKIHSKKGTIKGVKQNAQTR